VRDPALADVRRRVLDTIFAVLINLLTLLDLADNPAVLLLETLVSVGVNPHGRRLLLVDWQKPLMDLVGLFVGKIDKLMVRASAIQADFGGWGAGGEDLPAEYTSTKKFLGLFFRLYGAVHDSEGLFVQQLFDHFQVNPKP